MTSENETKEVTKTDSGTSQIVMMEEQLLQRIEAVDRMTKLINTRTDPRTDLNIVQGQPCRNGNLAKKLYRMFGGTFAYIKDNEGIPIVRRIDQEDGHGKYYYYEAYGRYTPPFGYGDAVEASGMFSSRDSFFGKDQDGWKPLDEVNEQDVRQAAQTECFKKCVFTACGLGRLTLEECEEAGMDMTKCEGYQGRSNAGSKGGSTDTEEDGDVRAEIEKMCREMFANGLKHPETGKPFNSIDDLLKVITTTETWRGWDSIARISAKGLGITLKGVLAVYTEWQKSAGIDDDNVPLGEGPEGDGK